MGLRDFQQLQDHLQHLEFKVWEHPNLKVSTLTLKNQFLFFLNIGIASVSYI